MALKNILQERLSELLTCLGSVESLINAHVANFFTENLWDQSLPSAVRNNLETLPDFTKKYLLFLKHKDHGLIDDCPALLAFLTYPSSVRLKCNQVLTSVDFLMSKFEKRKGGHVPIIKDFMSPKKKHEVLEAFPIIVLLTNNTEGKHIVDVGGGKGYLGTTLAKHLGVNVLSLDSSTVNTLGAAKREKMIEKKSKEMFNSGGKIGREIVFVTPNLRIEPLMKRFFSCADRVGILGLHTCGDLASTCCKLFIKDDADAAWLFNVGCCYHLINEKYSSCSVWNDLETSEDHGFPLSAFLNQKEANLGRNARMLAAHSLDRLARDGINEESANSLFYRAVLQVLIERSRGHCLQEGNIGKLFGKTANFHHYIRSAIKKLDLPIEITDEEISQLWESHIAAAMQLKVFVLLRTHFAPLIEMVILIDRLLYLHEQGVSNAFLVPLFAPDLSPRNHAIVAWR